MTQWPNTLFVTSNTSVMLFVMNKAASTRKWRLYTTKMQQQIRFDRNIIPPDIFCQHNDKMLTINILYLSSCKNVDTEHMSKILSDISALFNFLW